MDELTEIINQITSNPESMRQIQAMASSLGLNNAAAPAPQPPAPPPTQTPDLSSLAGLLGNLTSGGSSAPPPVQTPDFSALAGLLGNLTGGGSPAPPPAQTPDLSSLAGLLGNLTGGGSPAPPPTQTPDLSSLAGLLGNLTGGGTPAPSPAQTPDFSALAGLLGNLTGGGAPPAQQQASTPSDLSALTALLGGGAKQSSASQGAFPNINMNTVMKLSSAFSSMQSNRANIDLLLALKPRLKDERAKKVDDAIRVMQLIQFLPLIKESGLFGEMDNTLGDLVGGSGLGGLGGLLGNVGSGISGLFGGLGRR